jgi:hypothetical protein
VSTRQFPCARLCMHETRSTDPPTVWRCSVRARGFRHEKTKKKRGGYRGGLIDDGQVNSIKWDYGSDDE